MSHPQVPAKAGVSKRDDVSAERTRAHPVKELARSRGVSQRELSARLGWSVEFVNRVLAGIVPSTPAFRSAIAAFFDLPEAQLFHEEAERRSRTSAAEIRAAERRGRRARRNAT